MANPEDLGRYRLKRLLGRGVRGEVWEACDVADERGKVAVKIMHAADDDLIAARIHFAREARLAALLRHPHLVVIQDAGEAAGTSFLVMDMIEGRSLRELIDAPPPTPELTLEDKLRWLSEIGGALDAMHRAGVAHRDLKPENVIVRPDGTACLVDLGICKWMKFERSAHIHPEDANDLESAHERDDAPDEPPEYVPPETTSDEVYDDLGDQYAWGVLAYELLTGRRPSTGAPRLIEERELPRGVAETIDRAREGPRGARWESMGDLVARLAVEIEAARAAPPSREAREAREGPMVSRLAPEEGDVSPFLFLVAVGFVGLIVLVLLRVP
jgi:serine/threonine-protein kinase